MLAEPYGKPMLYSGYRFTNYDAPPAVDSRGVIGRISDVECVTEPSERKDKASYQNGDWVCQHRWPSTLGMIRFREVVADAPRANETKGLGFASFSRGDRGFFAVNLGKEPFSKSPVQTGMAPGSYCDVMGGGVGNDGNCEGLTIEVASDGTLVAPVAANSAIAIHLETKR
jgi:alpha-amylase